MALAGKQSQGSPGDAFTTSHAEECFIRRMMQVSQAMCFVSGAVCEVFDQKLEAVLTKSFLETITSAAIQVQVAHLLHVIEAHLPLGSRSLQQQIRELSALALSRGESLRTKKHDSCAEEEFTKKILENGDNGLLKRLLHRNEVKFSEEVEQLVQPALAHFEAMADNLVLPMRETDLETKIEQMQRLCAEMLTRTQNEQSNRLVQQTFASRLHSQPQEELPEDFCCPITHEKMDDPVLASDGCTYERRAIEEWLLRNNSSPTTRQHLSRALHPNLNLRARIATHEEASERRCGVAAKLRRKNSKMVSDASRRREQRASDERRRREEAERSAQEAAERRREAEERLREEAVRRRREEELEARERDLYLTLRAGAAAGPPSREVAGIRGVCVSTGQPCKVCVRGANCRYAHQGRPGHL